MGVPILRTPTRHHPLGPQSPRANESGPTEGRRVVNQGVLSAEGPRGADTRPGFEEKPRLLLPRSTGDIPPVSNLLGCPSPSVGPSSPSPSLPHSGGLVTPPTPLPGTVTCHWGGGSCRRDYRRRRSRSCLSPSVSPSLTTFPVPERRDTQHGSRGCTPTPYNLLT